MHCVLSSGLPRRNRDGWGSWATTDSFLPRPPDKAALGDVEPNSAPEKDLLTKANPRLTLTIYEASVTSSPWGNLRKVTHPSQCLSGLTGLLEGQARADMGPLLHYNTVLRPEAMFLLIPRQPLSSDLQRWQFLPPSLSVLGSWKRKGGRGQRGLCPQPWRLAVPSAPSCFFRPLHPCCGDLHPCTPALHPSLPSLPGLMPFLPTVPVSSS